MNPSQVAGAGQGIRERAAGKWLLWILLIPLGDVCAEVLLRALQARFDPLVTIWPWAWNGPVWMHALRPVGAIALAVVALLWECGVAGYERSSLKRLLTPAPSANVDLFYMMVYASNLKTLFGFAFSLGIGQIFYFWLNRHFSFGLLSGRSFLASLSVLTFVNTFLFYWVHRIMHTRLFWPVHKVHHSATELVMITNFRNHPLNVAVETILYSISAALLGASFQVELAYLIFNGVYQLWAHAGIEWNFRAKGLGFVQNWLLLAPEEHRLHHSKNPAHWNTNYGTVPFWDRLFGTWLDCRTVPRPEAVGLDDENDQEMLGSIRGFFVIMRKFLRLPV